MMYDKVKEFRLKLKLPVSDVPALLQPEHMSFYARFIMEELSELMRAHEKETMVDAADAITDLIYVAMGCAHHMGLPLEQVFNVVHDANMQKTPGSTNRGVKQDAQKPEGWQPPEEKINKILNKYLFTSHQTMV